MFGLGASELFVILILGLVFFGPEQVPKLAHKIGQWRQKMQTATQRLNMAVSEELQLEESSFKELRQELHAIQGLLPKSIEGLRQEANQDSQSFGEEAKPECAGSRLGQDTVSAGMLPAQGAAQGKQSSSECLAEPSLLQPAQGQSPTFLERYVILAKPKLLPSVLALRCSRWHFPLAVAKASLPQACVSWPLRTARLKGHAVLKKRLLKAIQAKPALGTQQLIPLTRRS